MAGLYELWRDPTARRTTTPTRGSGPCTILTTTARATSSAGSTTGCRCSSSATGTPTGSTRRVEETDRAARAARARGARPARRPTRCRRDVSNVRNNGPELVEPLPAEVPTGAAVGRADDQPALLRSALSPTPRRRRAGAVRRGRAPPAATLVLGHGAGGGIGAADLVALAAGCRRGHRGGPRRAAVAGGRPRVAAPPPSSTGLARRRSSTLAAAPARWSSAAAVAGARVACRTAAAVGAGGVCAWPSRCTRPGGRRSRGCRRADLPAAAGLPTLVVQGERGPVRRPGEVPAAQVGAGGPAPSTGDHSLRVPAAAGGRVLVADRGE